MEDYLVKALAYQGLVRAYAVAATDTVAEAQREQSLWMPMVTEKSKGICKILM